MLRPAISQMLNKNESCYSFVIAVAKRAREIIDEKQEGISYPDAKPVKIAVDEFSSGKLRIVEDPSLRKLGKSSNK